MKYEVSKLSNNIDYIYRKNANTPRMALCLNVLVNEPEKKAGIYSLMARLLLQGTKKYSSEELANEFEKYAIDFSCDVFPNYLRVRFTCLNEDFDKALELMNEVLVNSTFDEFEKEKIKLKGEISTELDSPRALATDTYCKEFYGNHYYGNSMTRVLENLDSIEKHEVVEAYKTILENSKKSLAIVGALDKNDILPEIEKNLGVIPQSVEGHFNIEKPILTEKHEATVTLENINQAHILKGWQVPTSTEEDYPALVLLNIMLGACGLSSRLFLELRDKKGLAYVVRSSYETLKLTGNFYIYIATEPKNIDVSLNGFDEEIRKIKTIPVSEKELQDAKNNFVGKCAFLEETNMQQACMYAKNEVLGLGFDNVEKVIEKIKNVTVEQVQACASKYFTNDKYVLSVVKP